MGACSDSDNRNGNANILAQIEGVVQSGDIGQEAYLVTLAIMRTFNSLANMLAACVQKELHCG